MIYLVGTQELCLKLGSEKIMFKMVCERVICCTFGLLIAYRGNINNEKSSDFFNVTG